MLYRLSARDSRKIKEARIAAGITQEDLAASMKCTQSYIAKLEAGKEGATKEFLERLCVKLHLTAEITVPKVTLR